MDVGPINGPITVLEERKEFGVVSDLRRSGAVVSRQLDIFSIEILQDGYIQKLVDDPVVTY